MRAIVPLLVATFALLAPATASAAPSASLESIVEGLNPQYQHAAGPTLWFNPAQNGSFEVRVAASDPVAVDRVSFPSLGLWWTGGGDDTSGPSPYTMTYTWSPGSTATPGPVPVIAWAGSDTASTAFEARADAVPPHSTSITVTETVSTDTSIPVQYAIGTDDDSGLDTRVIQRRSASAVAGSCGGFSAWSNVTAMNPPTSWTDASVVDGTCYQYRLLATDRVGNTSVDIDPEPVIVDLSAATPDVVIDTSAGVGVAEGGLGTSMDVALATQPTANVSVWIVGDAQLDPQVPQVVFTPATWNVPQIVAIEAVDDAVAETDPHDGLLSVATSSTDPLYDLLAVPDLVFDVTDDDVAGVTTGVGGGLAVVEGGATDTFTMQLDTMPTSDVQVDLASLGSQVTVVPTTLTFTAASWNAAQVVTVTAVTDAVAEGAHTDTLSLDVTSLDATYDALALADISVDVTDGGAPTPSASATFAGFTELVGSQYQHAAGSTLWFNPAFPGSFRVDATATGTPGLASVGFPVLGAGWNPASPTTDTTAPYQATYAWTAGATTATPSIITATSTGGATATAPFSVRADVIAPTDVTITAQSTVTRDTSAPVSGATGSDAQSGIGSWRYQRRTAALGGDVCAAWSAWSDIGPANPVGTHSDAALPDGTCAQYRFIVADNVANTTIATQDGELRIDRTSPVATIDPVAGGLHGTVTLSGTASDATTRVRSVAVMVEDRYSICSSATLEASGRWTCEWTIGAHELGAANIKVTATDAAGQRTSVTQSVTMVKPPSPLGPREEDIDRTPPVVGLARMPLVSWTPGVKVKASAFDDRPGTVEVRVEQQSARILADVFSPWVPSYEEADVFPLDRRGETTCFRGIAFDEAGNKAVSDPRCTTLPLDDVDLKATGAWKRVTDTKAYLGAVRRATKAGAALTVRLADATPAIAVSKCKGCGAIKVFHGSRLVGTYQLAARTTLQRQLIQLPVLKRPTSQPLRIVSASAKPVMVDGVVTSR